MLFSVVPKQLAEASIFKVLVDLLTALLVLVLYSCIVAERVPNVLFVIYESIFPLFSVFKMQEIQQGSF